MDNLQEILKREFFQTAKDLPDDLRFFRAIFAEGGNSKVETEALMSHYDKISRNLTFIELYGKSDPAVRKEEMFQYLEQELRRYHALLRETIIRILEGDEEA